MPWNFLQLRQLISFLKYPANKIKLYVSLRWMSFSARQGWKKEFIDNPYFKKCVAKLRGSIFPWNYCRHVFINFLCVRLGTIKLFKYCESILIVRWEWSSRHNPLSTKDPYLLVKGRVISWRRLASIPAIEITETGSRCSGEVNLQNNDGSVLGLLYLVTGNR